MKRILFSIIVLTVFVIGCSPYGNLEKMEFDELQYPFEVKKAVIDEEITIAYVDEGAGEQTIIFVHGLGSYLPAWKKNIEDLKNDYRCIAIDLPGYGKSSKPIHSGMMDYYAETISKFMDKLELKSAVIAGHSMGAQIAMVMALKYPDKVEKLILAAPAGFEYFHPGQKQWFRDVMTVDAVKLTPVQQIRANLASNFYNMPEDAEFMVTDRIALREAVDFDKYCYAVVRSVNGMVDQPVLDHLEKIQQPTLILFGENDNLIPNRFLNAGFTEDVAKIGQEKIPNSKLVLIPSCGHFLQFEKPETFNKEVRDFLK